MSDILLPNPSDLSVEMWPPQPTHGMLVGRITHGVKITHKPTGLFATCDESRSMHKNRAKALELLGAMLAEREKE